MSGGGELALAVRNLAVSVDALQQTTGNNGALPAAIANLCATVGHLQQTIGNNGALPGAITNLSAVIGNGQQQGLMAALQALQVQARAQRSKDHFKRFITIATFFGGLVYLGLTTDSIVKGGSGRAFQATAFLQIVSFCLFLVVIITCSFSIFGWLDPPDTAAPGVADSIDKFVFGGVVITTVVALLLLFASVLVNVHIRWHGDSWIFITSVCVLGYIPVWALIVKCLIPNLVQ